MPRRKPKPERVVQEQIKASLDSILSDESLGIESVKPDELPRLKSTEIMDFKEASLTTGSDAKSLMDSVVKFYLDENYIEQTEYIEYKKKIDSMNLASMMLQLKTAQHAITKLLEEIDLGNANPRMFEVLAQLQSQIMQMPKDYQVYLNKMEDGYKKIQDQIEQDVDRGSLQIEVGQAGDNVYNPKKVESGGIKVRGTKGLMEGLRDIIGAEIEDVTIDDDIDENAIVNAKKKAEIDSNRHIEIDGNEDSNLEVDDDLFN